ncbi:MAG: hypothetical protein AAFN10_26635 [Bacteroidota bacterium]
MDHNYLNGLQEYLEASGVLEHGSKEDIQTAKKAYKKQYQAAYRRARRRSHPETTVTLTQKQWHYLSAEAKRHQLSLPKFMRQAALAYLKQTYLVPNGQAVAKIEQLISLARTDIQIIARHQSQLGREDIAKAYQSLLERYMKLEMNMIMILG